MKDVLDLLAAGADRAEILADYPYLEEADIVAVLEFAAKQSDHPVLRTAWCASSWTRRFHQRSPVGSSRKATKRFMSSTWI